jgi:hypothetical protein
MTPDGHYKKHLEFVFQPSWTTPGWIDVQSVIDTAMGGTLATLLEIFDKYRITSFKITHNNNLVLDIPMFGFADYSATATTPPNFTPSTQFVVPCYLWSEVIQQGVDIPFVDTNLKHIWMYFPGGSELAPAKITFAVKEDLEFDQISSDIGIPRIASSQPKLRAEVNDLKAMQKQNILRALRSLPEPPNMDESELIIKEEEPKEIPSKKKKRGKGGF